jgi:hypothetical protein
VTARYDANATHFNANGEPVTVQCVHLFAMPAVADAGVYMKPNPYSLFGFGWLTWPERGMSCKPASASRVAAAGVPAVVPGVDDVGTVTAPRADVVELAKKNDELQTHVQMLQALVQNLKLERDDLGQKYKAAMLVIEVGAGLRRGANANGHFSDTEVPR